MQCAEGGEERKFGWKRSSREGGIERSASGGGAGVRERSGAGAGAEEDEDSVNAPAKQTLQRRRSASSGALKKQHPGEDVKDDEALGSRDGS